jgi:hypothetical protein
MATMADKEFLARRRALEAGDHATEIEILMASFAVPCNFDGIPS